MKLYGGATPEQESFWHNLANEKAQEWNKTGAHVEDFNSHRDLVDALRFEIAQAALDGNVKRFETLCQMMYELGIRDGIDYPRVDETVFGDII